MQETKCPNAEFPEKKFNELGYHHIAIHGQPSYNGVAVISKIPFQEPRSKQFCGLQDARHLAVRLDVGQRPILHSFYVPAGGDVPDPGLNDKFKHKLEFLQEMKEWLPVNGGASILLGDLNIAPLETDVWSHKKLLKVVSHTPVEVDALNEVAQAGEWMDVVRQHIPENEKLYSWWSYRARDWSAADKGRRLDHIWCDKTMASLCTHAEIVREARGWDRPSDHAPVISEFRL